MTDDAVQRICTQYQSDFGRRLKDADITEWGNTLRQVRLSDELALSAYAAFRAGWRKDRKPQLYEIVRFMAQYTTPKPARRVGEMCFYCKDTGGFPLAAPVKIGGQGLDAATPGFYPGLPWTETMLYEVFVPCYCTRGLAMEKRDGLNEKWRAFREKWKNLYDREGHVRQTLNRFLIDSGKKRQARLKEAREEKAEVVLDVPDGEIPF